MNVRIRSNGQIFLVVREHHLVYLLPI
jgi:hypothetical protein